MKIQRYNTWVEYEDHIERLERRLAEANKAWLDFIQSSYHHKNSAWHRLTNTLKEQINDEK